jgi:hypothetical protein
MNELYGEVHVYIDVFVVLMLKCVFGEIYGTLIVAPNVGWMLLMESKIRKNLSKP